MLLGGCTFGPQSTEPPAPVALSKQYFADSNAAARSGPAAQRDFFHQRQHPDFPVGSCDLGATTVDFDPAYGTLRPAPDFAADGIEPRGRVWVVAVEVTTREQENVTDRQIGSQHLVELDDELYGFAPCSSS